MESVVRKPGSVSSAVYQCEGLAWQYVDPRWQELEGPIVDIGCANWKWSRQFAKRRRVIGYDPFAQWHPDWADYERAAVMPLSGTAVLNRDAKHPAKSGIASEGTPTTVDAVAFADVLGSHASIVKMNIEGGEYLLLPVAHHPVADQLVVSFHGWLNPQWDKLDQGFIEWLSYWYEPECLHEEWRWYLFRARR